METGFLLAYLVGMEKPIFVSAFVFANLESIADKKFSSYICSFFACNILTRRQNLVMLCNDMVSE